MAQTWAQSSGCGPTPATPPPIPPAVAVPLVQHGHDVVHGLLVASASASVSPPGRPARRRRPPGSARPPGRLARPTAAPGHQAGDLRQRRHPAVGRLVAMCGGGQARRRGDGAHATRRRRLRPQVVVRRSPGFQPGSAATRASSSRSGAVPTQQVLVRATGPTTGPAVPGVPQRHVSVRPGRAPGRCTTAARASPARAPPRPPRPAPSAGRWWLTAYHQHQPGHRVATTLAGQPEVTRTPASSGRSPVYTPMTSSLFSGALSSRFAWLMR